MMNQQTILIAVATGSIGGGAAVALVIDFTDMESVRLAAAEAMNRFLMIHGLILSAVILLQNGPNILPSGHEMMFAANVMGPFLFNVVVIDPGRSNKEMNWQIVFRVKLKYLRSNYLL